MIAIIKRIISALFEKMGYHIIKKGSLRTLTGKDFPFSHEMVPRPEYAFSHNFVRGYPDVTLESYELNPTHEDTGIAGRVLESYHKAKNDERYAGQKTRSDLWDVLGQAKHREFVQVLERKDSEKLAHDLCNMSKRDITHGLTQGKDTYDQIISNENVRREHAAFYMDKLVALGEALGCLPFENPESGRWGENFYENIDELIGKIEEVIGIDITPPKISGGLFGISTKKGVFHFRDINSIYTAWRVQQLVKDVEDPAICEIGAGSGGVAYYCYKMGIRNITIIDLPRICVISGYYLIKALPNAKVILYGEKNADISDAIKLYPYWKIDQIPNDYFALTLNQDSFPEINKDIVTQYLHQIRRNTTKYFLSINQEGQAPQTGADNLLLVVSQVIKQFSDSYERVYRFPYWVREGYLEELYRIRK